MHWFQLRLPLYLSLSLLFPGALGLAQRCEKVFAKLTASHDIFYRVGIGNTMELFRAVAHVPEERRQAYDAKKEELRQLTQTISGAPTAALPRLLEFGRDLPAKFVLSDPIELSATTVENIVNQTHLDIYLRKQFSKHTPMVYRPLERQIHIPSGIRVKNRDGTTRPLNLSSPYEKQIAVFFAKAALEEVCHSMQYAYNRPLQSTPLMPLETYQAYQKWLRENEAKVAAHLEPFIRDNLPHIRTALLAEWYDTHKDGIGPTPEEKQRLDAVASQRLNQFTRDHLMREINELDVMLWMERNGAPMSEMQIGLHSLSRPLFLQFLNSQR